MTPHTRRLTGAEDLDYVPGRRINPVTGVEELQVACWCMAEVRHVATVDVRNGVTWSCGRDGCGPELVA